METKQEAAESAEQQQPAGASTPVAAGAGTTTTKSASEQPSQEQQATAGGGISSSSNGGDGGSSGADSKADTEDDEQQLQQQQPHGTVGSGRCGGDVGGSPCECVQCEVCMAENWWRMAAYHNSLLQIQQGGGIENIDLNSSPAFEISESTATGLDMISSAATLMLTQQQAAANGVPGLPTTDDVLRAEFSMPKLREFFECQKQMGIPNFPEDFDEFWLLVVKARLFNIFKYRGPEAYNRVVLKIRDIARKFRSQLDEREGGGGNGKRSSKESIGGGGANKEEVTAAATEPQKKVKTTTVEKPTTKSGGGKQKQKTGAAGN